MSSSDEFDTELSKTTDELIILLYNLIEEETKKKKYEKDVARIYLTKPRGTPKELRRFNALCLFTNVRLKKTS